MTPINTNNMPIELRFTDESQLNSKKLSRELKLLIYTDDGGVKKLDFKLCTPG